CTRDRGYEDDYGYFSPAANRFDVW
nr:immunoglobulin heavy chain junction region [Macaca mulatta]